MSTKAELRSMAADAARRGAWMVRFAKKPGDLQSYNGFRWNEPGEWTEAPDWNPKVVCGGGLHGQGPQTGGYRHDCGPTLVFCETYGKQVSVESDKVKVRRARILLWDELPDGLTADGWLNLSGCTGLTSLPAGLTIGGGLSLSSCTGLTSLPAGLTIGGWLDLSECTRLMSLPASLTTGGGLYLWGCTGLTSLPDDLTVGGGLYLWGCTGLPKSHQHYWESLAAYRAATK